jgi:hypothetical protein
VNVAYDADDVPGRFFKLPSNPLADDDLLPQGIFLVPIFFCHAHVDKHNTRGAGYIAVGEVTPAQDGYLESFEVSG